MAPLVGARRPSSSESGPTARAGAQSSPQPKSGSRACRRTLRARSWSPSRRDSFVSGGPIGMATHNRTTWHRGIAPIHGPHSPEPAQDRADWQKGQKAFLRTVDRRWAARTRGRRGRLYSRASVSPNVVCSLFAVRSSPQAFSARTPSSSPLTPFRHACLHIVLSHRAPWAAPRLRPYPGSRPWHVVPSQTTNTIWWSTCGVALSEFTLYGEFAKSSCR